MAETDSIPSSPGTYALMLELEAPRQVRVGALGRPMLPAGAYVYAGSARGPGGLRARLRHHRRPSIRPHWHLDYVRPYLSVRGVWFAVGEEPLECRWARALLITRPLRAIVPGFGSSDCRCPAHLLWADCTPRILVEYVGSRIPSGSFRRLDWG